MKKVFLIILGASTLLACHSKNEETTASANPKNDIEQSKPKGNWTVKKEVDENGNLIKYDSIYSYSSSGNSGDFSNPSMDSIMHGFSKSMHQQFFSNSGDPMMDMDDFFDDEMNDPAAMMAQMQQQMQQQMQAMRSQMFQDQPAIPAEPQSK
ncbi:hypothetical protein [Gaetbulibacter aestuarii]|uniref:Lipoprotein n=1 Tax=Gaetbulibacter aestuarii TaxID=1502358 RepID=A0ABW7N1H2_9FLAO